MKRAAALTIPIALALASCGDPDPAGGISAEEERQLDEAARKLEADLDNLPQRVEEGEAELEAMDQEPAGNAQ